MNDHRAGRTNLHDTADIVRGSIAASSFDDALALLAEHPPQPPRVRVAYDFTTPAGAPSDRAALPGDGGVAGAGPAGPLTSAAEALRQGTTTATELVERALAAITDRNDELVALVHVDAAGALAEAARQDELAAAGTFVGPLHGIPVTVKDVIDVGGMPTRCASATYDGRPELDAAGVQRLRDAGAIVIGKAATHEFALGVTSPQSRNPWDPSRIPGGSSGGSAAAVASGMGLGSLGTDTRASIRVPAALSGVVGFKPTYGRIPTDGVVSLSWTMDHVAPMASTVTDAALMLQVLLDDGRDLSSAPPTVAGLRVGVARAGFADAPAALAELVDATIASLGRRGARLGVSERPAPLDLELANAAGLIVSRVEAAAAHRSLGLDLDTYWEEVGDQLRAAADVAGIDYVDAQRVRSSLAERLLAAFDDHDVIVMPTAPVVAPPVDDFAGYLMLLSRNAIPWSFVGFPAISVPCGSVDGLPVGLQIVAAPDREDLLVQVGRTVELVR